MCWQSRESDFGGIRNFLIWSWVGTVHYWTIPPKVGSRSGARTLGAGGISTTFAVALSPTCHSHVSSPRHVERSVPFSGTTLPCLLLVRVMGPILLLLLSADSVEPGNC
jgi:hypothetical protein